MVSKRSLILVVSAVVLLLVPSAAAQDQSRVADTTLNISANDFLSVGNTLARNDQTFGFVNWEFCHGAGGFNPQNAQFELTLTIEGAPEWLDVAIGEDPVQVFTPPVGPTVNEQCPPNTKGGWELSAKAARDAPYGETATITAIVTVEETGSSHTYKIPEGGQREMSLEIESDPGDDITRQLDNATRDPNPSPTPTGGGGGSEESPGPFMAFVLSLALLAALVRRR